MSDLYNYSNADSFANDIIDDSLDAMRDLEEAQGEQTIQGSFPVSPVGFTNEKRHFIFGPIKFIKRFGSIPYPSFGTYNPPVADTETEISTVSVAGAPTNYLPWVVQPYVYQWRWENGEVDGLMVGLYAITVPTPSTPGITVSWKMVGQASRYSNPGDQEAWTESYNYNEASYLEDGGGYDEVETEGEIGE